MQYNLEERLVKFSTEMVVFLKTIKQDSINSPIINQLVRSCTSVGANYCEANQASSRNDFKNKIFICKKEINETKYWLQVLLSTDNKIKEQIDKFMKESQELLLIFSKIISTLNSKQ